MKCISCGCEMRSSVDDYARSLCWVCFSPSRVQVTMAQQVEEEEIASLRALVAELTTRLEEAREALGEVVHQACAVEGAERLDSSALRTYADALRLLASWGQVRITSETGRRVIAEWVER